MKKDLILKKETVMSLEQDSLRAIYGGTGTNTEPYYCLEPVEPPDPESVSPGECCTLPPPSVNNYDCETGDCPEPPVDPSAPVEPE